MQRRSVGVVGLTAVCCVCTCPIDTANFNFYACNCEPSHYRCCDCANQPIIGFDSSEVAPRLAQVGCKLAVAQAQSYLAETMTERAVHAVLSVRRRDSTESVAKLTSRIASLGLTGTVQALCDFISHSPVIVHVKIEKLGIAQAMLTDSHLRNQFETSISGGHFDPRPEGTRAQWEGVQFSNVYDSSCGFIRPKYGVCNFTRDIRGVFNCRQYGTCFLLLKPDVRMRCTVTAEDSGSLKPLPMGTFDNPVNVVAHMTDKELQVLDELSSGRRRWANSKVHDQYTEVQIHGEVRFSHDVAAIGVSAKALRRPLVAALIEQFCDRHGIAKIVIPEAVADGDAVDDVFAA